MMAMTNTKSVIEIGSESGNGRRTEIGIVIKKKKSEGQELDRDLERDRQEGVIITTIKIIKKVIDTKN